MTIRIVTDSTCDLPPDRVARWGIQVVPMYINVGPQGYRDGVDLTRDAFYRQLPDFPVHPTTATPSSETFRAVYAGLAAEGDILTVDVTPVIGAHLGPGAVGFAAVAARQDLRGHAGSSTGSLYSAIL